MKLKKVPYSSAHEILALYEADEEFVALAESDSTPYDLIQLGIKNDLHSEAIKFLAHGMPIREAVWWAVICAEQRKDWNDKELAAIGAARAWVKEPDETSRRYAEDMAGKVGLETGAGWVAQAAFWSGGNMLAPGAPFVPPPPYAYAQAVAGAITLTAVLPEGEGAEEFYQQFFVMGLDIAQGGNGLNQLKIDH
ncbi:DUF6931 family protein [Parashewanella tropica]|uniref:DUF6931 family protein n=1 Tax=Parashewanella tropica TaxID=2547970 RepID=UPI001059DCC5|nr:Twin-arginine translocation pathway signal [Parashewanella tropica]